MALICSECIWTQVVLGGEREGPQERPVLVSEPWGLTHSPLLCTYRGQVLQVLRTQP